MPRAGRGRGSSSAASKNPRSSSTGRVQKALERCKPHDFCGYARRDYGFIFHRCTCPLSHQCKFDLDESQSEVSELFYRGPAYLARCVPIYDYDWW
ncbi:uncharacterized protein LOC120417613 isoform X2 [Culex pipiens pallens]|uniref:uncharacterized protein LOC120417613 isoform X2 n=1 Tax=Culex pipiens pallens TaxID=42434 RepID=UPI0022AA7471|nr:uncharacterized protein LOC120417613 isoform X2 [Culex pipiens pallens]